MNVYMNMYIYLSIQIQCVDYVSIVAYDIFSFLLVRKGTPNKNKNKNKKQIAFRQTTKKNTRPVSNILKCSLTLCVPNTTCA